MKPGTYVIRHIDTYINYTVKLYTTLIHNVKESGTDKLKG